MTNAGTPAEWLPFANSGFGVAQYYLLLHHYVIDYYPDVVIVLLVPNDLYDSSPYLISDKSSVNTVHVNEKGEVSLYPARQFQSSWYRRTVYSTAMGRFLFAQYQIHRQGGGLQGSSYRVFRREEQGGALLLGGSLSVQERARLSWRHAEDMMRLMRDECARANTPLLFAYCGNNPRLDAMFEEREYEPAPVEQDPYCMNERIWEMGRSLFERAAAALGVEYRDLTAALAVEANRVGRRHDYVGDDHYSRVGHRAAGQALARRVMQMLSRPGRSTDHNAS